MQNKVLVLDTNRRPLMPCRPARAREFLEKGRASIFRRFPFTIILHDRTVGESELQDIEIKIDQGSKTTGITVKVDPSLKPLIIKATGRGSRQFCRMDKYGFPRTKAKPRSKNFFGFKTGDMVKVTIPERARTKVLPGVYTGRVATRSSGSFDVKTKNTKITVSHKYCKLIHFMDGYTYA